MARIEAVTHVEAPRRAVWDLLIAWERQPEWMVDARSVQVLSAAREGVGTTIRCRTNILGGVLVDDDLSVTEWHEESVLGMRHLGRLIRGVGAFELSETAYGTRLLWWEEAEVPFGALGDALAGVLVVPWVHRVFRRSLAGFKQVCEGRVPA